ncbi:hypothetical protein SRABI26_01487 [Arthrobacter sp. Bi26]|uniref:HNH endonuclease n=1 Tax=Arthrobacter sp. Bi26 TaxID=2822350 RepID=UPI001D44765B|nr:hypothetical protein SRABI26_01487 [Arthrobacter sp. Bi26]
MEAVRDFIACQEEGQDTDRGPAPVQQPSVDGIDGLDGALAALQALSATAVLDAGSWGFRAASDFAGRVEEFSRTVEFLQLVAASAVDRTRKQSAADAGAAGAVTSWTTGWRESPAGWETGGSGAAEPAGTAAAGASAGGASGAAAVTAAGSGSAAAAAPPASATAAAADVADGSAVPASVLDDGYRNTVEFLRARLRIGAAEARRRLSLAEALLPGQGLAGRPVPPLHRELGAAVAAGEVASRAASVITAALERVRPLCEADAAARMEHALTRTAAENDADFLVRVTRSWADALDQDGAEPSEELLRQLQGAFIRRRRHGLHHLEIFATTEQFEHLLTVMNTATNPRTGNTGTSPATDTAERSAAGATAAGDGWTAGTAFGVGWAAGAASGEASVAGAGWTAGAASGDASGGGGWAAGAASGEASVSAAAAGASACVSRADYAPSGAGASASDVSTGAGASAAATSPEHQPGPGDEPAADEDPALPALDLRSRAQRLLDGLVGACKVALAAGTLPAAGGLRPQVMATIDYRDLLTRLQNTPGATANTGQPGTGTGTGTGVLLFTGPVTASTIRKIACDADIIPVVLGGEGRVLDIGRASRVFPPHLRKAITARDRGCAFPGCTIPAPWCEAHHITYWSRGGTTGTENGVLLCSHHHHVIHKEHWTIRLKTGIPWFIPPPHLDPRQQPRRNHYFRPDDLVTAA